MSINDTSVDRRRVFRLALGIVGIGAAALLCGCELGAFVGLPKSQQEKDDENFNEEKRLNELKRNKDSTPESKSKSPS